MLFFLQFHPDKCTQVAKNTWSVTARKSRNEDELWKSAEVLKEQLMDLGYYVEMKKAG